MSTRHISIVGALIGVTAILGTATMAAPNREIISSAAYLQAQQLVEVESGRRLNLYCVGSGSPTVVFEAGLGEGMIVWALVQPQIGKRTRACAYDRAGLGFSDPSPEPRTSEFVVRDLRHLLETADIAPPFVLVGHSFGGMNIKLFAEEHQGEVAGLVFVDPSHEDLAKRRWEIEPQGAAANARYNEFLRSCLEAKPEEFAPGSRLVESCATPPFAERLSPQLLELASARASTHGYRQAWISEMLNVWTKSAEQLRAAHRSLDPLPIIVLTREPRPRREDQTQEIADAQNALTVELHKEIASMSTRGAIRVVHDSDHHFQLDQPQEVITAVRDVLDSIAANGE